MCGVLLVCLLPAHLKTAPGVADGNEEPYFNVHAQLTGLLVTSAPAPHPRMPICLQADDERPSRPRPKRHRAATDANCGRQARGVGVLDGQPGWCGRRNVLGTLKCTNPTRRRILSRVRKAPPEAHMVFIT